MKRSLVFVLFFYSIMYSKGVDNYFIKYLEAINPSTLAIILISVIVIIFLIASIFLIIELKIILTVERKALTVVKNNFGRINTSMTRDQMFKELSHNVGEYGTISKNRLLNIESIVSQDKKINYQDMLDSEYMQLSSKFSLSFINFARHNLIAIGLLGTFIGLSLMIVKIQGIFGNITDMESKMRAVTESMQIAFLTSLFGLITTIILSFFVSLYDQKQKKFMGDFEIFTVNKLIPLFSFKETDDIADKLMDVAKKLDITSSKFEKSSERVVLDMENINQISSIYKEATESIVKNQLSLHKLLEDTNGFVQELKDYLKNSKTENSVTLELLEKNQINLSDTTNSLKDMVLNNDLWIKEIINSSKDQHRDSINSIEKCIADSNTDFKNSLKLINSDIAENNSVISTELKNIGNLFKNKEINVDEIIGSIKSSAENISENLKSLNEKEINLDLIVDSIKGSTDTISEKLNDIKEKLEKRPTNSHRPVGISSLVPTENVKPIIKKKDIPIRIVEKPEVSHPSDKTGLITPNKKSILKIFKNIFSKK